MADRARVMVAGAGLAGLATAWHLQRRGFDVAVCEREAATGGAAASLTVQVSEGRFEIDRSWPVLSSSDRELHGWADALGVRDELLPLRPLVRGQLHRGRVREQVGRGWLALARTPGIPPHQALRLLRLPRLLARYAGGLTWDAAGRAAPLDDRSLGDFGRLYFGRAVLERWMAPLLAAQSPAETERSSRALFLRRYRHQQGARAGLPRAPLAELCEAAAGRLKLLTGTPVVHVERPARGPLQVALGAGGRIHEAEALVLATSAADAARLADPLLVAAERDFLGGTRYAAGLVLAVGLRRPLHPHPFLITVPPGARSPLEAVLLEPGVAGGRVPAGCGLALLRAEAGWARRHLEADEERLSRDLLEAFAAIDPAARGAALFTRLLRRPRAWPGFDVGRYRAIARFEDLQSELRRAGRRLYFAGDYLTDPSWEGALVSARRAADALAEDVSPAR